MVPTDNLISLHKHEEELRAKSLTAIGADPTLSEHWTFIAETMNAIWAFMHDHEHGSEDELTLQYLGVRLFNAGGASIKLALSGYYQKAFHHVRDIIETSFLVDYLTIYPDKIGQWRRADEKTDKQFRPVAVRNALDTRDGYTNGERKKIYALISKLASHPTYSGIAMTAMGPDNMVQVGPFFDEKKLKVWLQEMALRVSPAALALLHNPEGHDLKLLSVRMHYLEVVNEWWSKYRGLNVAKVAPRTAPP